MKKPAFIFLAVFMIMPCIFGQETSLNMAISEAANELAERLPNGTRIAVTNFGAPANDISEYVIDELVKHFVNSRKFSIVDRRFIEEARSELDFNSSGEVSDETAQGIGRFIGAQVMVSGSIRKLGNVYRLQIRAIRVETMEVQGMFVREINENDFNRIFGVINNFEGIWLVYGNGQFDFDEDFFYIVISGNEITLKCEENRNTGHKAGNVAKGIINIDGNYARGILTHIWGGWGREGDWGRGITAHNYWQTLRNWSLSNNTELDAEFISFSATIYGNRMEAGWNGLIINLAKQ